MTRTEDRLTDALTAAARAVPQETVRPLIAPPARRPLPAWITPLAAALGIVLVAGVALALGTSLDRAGRGIAPAAAGAPRYYVEAGLSDGHDAPPVVRSTATGAVTSTVPVPFAKDVPGYGTDTVASARNGLFFVASFVPGGGERVYRFRVTGAGRVTGFSALPGGVLGRGQWEATSIAATPDGSRVAVAFTFAGPSGSCGASSQPACPPPHADYIVGIDTATGTRTLWRGTTRDLGGASFMVQNLSWTADGRELVFLGRWCRGATTFAGARCGSGFSAAVRSLDPASGGPLESGRVLLRQSARFPYLAQALISPDGAALTAVVLRGAVIGSHAVSGAAPDNLSVEKVSVATGQRLATLYHRRLGPTSQIVGAPHFLVLSADVPGEHLLLNGGISGGAGYNNGFNGWIHHGQLIPLVPGDGWDAGEAW
jgi:hypothetical protein